MTRAQLSDLARRGARLRHEELEAEIAQLRAFLAGGETAPAPRAPRTRKTMSASTRAAVSSRMKKYWATWRKTHPNGRR